MAYDLITISTLLVDGVEQVWYVHSFSVRHNHTKSLLYILRHYTNAVISLLQCSAIKERPHLTFGTNIACLCEINDVILFNSMVYIAQH